MRNQERTIAPERAARLQAAHDAEIAAKNAEIAKLTERLAIANRRLQGLMAEQNLFPAVDRGMPRSPFATARPGLVRMSKSMKLPS